MLKRVRTAREEKTKVEFVKVLPGIFFGTSMLPINVLLRLFVVLQLIFLFAVSFQCSDAVSCVTGRAP